MRNNNDNDDIIIKNKQSQNSDSTNCENLNIEQKIESKSNLKTKHSSQLIKLEKLKLKIDDTLDSLRKDELSEQNRKLRNRRIYQFGGLFITVFGHQFFDEQAENMDLKRFIVAVLLKYKKFIENDESFTKDAQYNQFVRNFLKDVEIGKAFFTELELKKAQQKNAKKTVVGTTTIVAETSIDKVSEVKPHEQHQEIDLFHKSDEDTEDK